MSVNTLKLNTATARTVGLMIGACLVAAAILWASGIGRSTAADTAAQVPQGISLFNQTPTAVTGLPSKQQKAIATIGRLQKIDVGNLYVAAPGVWATTTGGKTCLLAENSEGIAASCGTNADATAGKLGINARSSTTDASENIGLVPDSVTAVSAGDSTGQAVATDKVSNNVFRVKGNALKALTFSGTSPARTVAIAG